MTKRRTAARYGVAQDRMACRAVDKPYRAGQDHSPPLVNLKTRYKRLLRICTAGAGIICHAATAINNNSRRGVYYNNIVPSKLPLLAPYSGPNTARTFCTVPAPGVALAGR